MMSGGKENMQIHTLQVAHTWATGPTQTVHTYFIAAVDGLVFLKDLSEQLVCLLKWSVLCQLRKKAV